MIEIAGLEEGGGVFGVGEIVGAPVDANQAVFDGQGCGVFGGGCHGGLSGLLSAARLLLKCLENVRDVLIVGEKLVDCLKWDD